ncbi:MAG: pilus assembly protein PilP [Nitrospirota bacterium]
MEKRTKLLIVLLLVLLVAAAGSYFYRRLKARNAPPTKMVLKLGAPIKKGQKPGVPPAPASNKPASAANAPGQKPAQKPEQKKAEEPVVIKTVEAGKEIQYNTPEDFVKRTKLSQSDAEAYVQLKLDDARKSLDMARNKKDAAAADRAEKETALYEKAAVLLKQRVLSGPGTTYAYSSLGKRDPFMSPFEVPKVYPPVPRDATPLERVPVDKLKVEAIVWNRKGFRAMILTPDGRGYTVRTGQHVGDKGGWIARISRSRVYVTEKIKDILGDVETNNVVLPLHKEAE